MGAPAVVPVARVPREKSNRWSYKWPSTNVRSVLVIIRQILTTKPSEMAFVERDDVINHLSARTADPTFGDSVLPRASNARSHGSHAARLQQSEDVIAELRIAIKQGITVQAGQRQSLT